MNLKVMLLGLMLSVGFVVPAFAEDMVDINSADAATLSHIVSGIGEVKAQAIVEYRNKHGFFSSVDGLLAVKGIGELSLAKIRNQLVASPGDADME